MDIVVYITWKQKLVQASDITLVQKLQAITLHLGLEIRAHHILPWLRNSVLCQKLADLKWLGFKALLR